MLLSPSSSVSCRVLLVVAVLLIGWQAAAADFEAAYRDRSAIYLLSSVGDGIYVPQPAGAPKRILSFFDAAGRPYRWQKNPTGFARWRSQWIVADTTNRLVRFNEKGIVTGFIELPARASSLATPGDGISFLNPLAVRPSQQLWHSSDGKTFRPVPQPDAVEDETFSNPTRNLVVVAGSPDGALYFAWVIGPPVLRRALDPAGGKTFPLAYSRTKLRSSLDEVVGDSGDVTRYSLPTRDLLALEGGSVVVLRNREDVPDGAGRSKAIQGLRADRYDAAGRHVATATFSEPVRWLSSPRSDGLSGITREGATVTAQWAKPLPGIILP